jgi:hypothetical protein
LRSLQSVLILLIVSLPLSLPTSASEASMTLLARGDCEGAIESLRADANQDPAGAGYYLALCLIQNDGSVLDVQSLLRRAAASGNVRAQYTLGLLDALR